MKTVCDFCKTEYTLDAVPMGPVKCAVCGHTWVVQRPPRRNSILIFIAALCALLSAVIFAMAVLYMNQVKEIREKPLVAELNDITTDVDENGVMRYVVSGRVVNRSEQIYGVPSLVVSSFDADGNVIERQRFLPTATLLEPGDDTRFMHILTVPINNVEKISVDLESHD